MLTSQISPGQVGQGGQGQGQGKKVKRMEMVIKRLSGEYAACGFEVLLTRKHEPLVFQVKTNHHHHNNHHHHHDHFEQVYIPCILFVTVSWISFVIDPTVRQNNNAVNRLSCVLSTRNKRPCFYHKHALPP